MRVLVLFAHPRLRQSVVQRAMLSAIASLDGVTIRDLYAEYPDLLIDAKREQDTLLEHDVIVLQHPLYWYSAPAIVKEWLDIVLEEGWAYGAGGRQLRGKYLLNAISTGGPQEAYHGQGRNRFPVRTLLAPFDQTAYLCGMGWLEPFVIHAGRKLEPQRAVEPHRAISRPARRAPRRSARSASTLGRGLSVAGGLPLGSRACRCILTSS